MKAAFSKRFIRQYSALSTERKGKFSNQVGFLLANHVLDAQYKGCHTKVNQRSSMLKRSSQWL